MRLPLALARLLLRAVLLLLRALAYGVERAGDVLALVTYKLEAWHFAHVLAQRGVRLAPDRVVSSDVAAPQPLRTGAQRRPSKRAQEREREREVERVAAGMVVTAEQARETARRYLDLRDEDERERAS